MVWTKGEALTFFDDHDLALNDVQILVAQVKHTFEKKLKILHGEGEAEKSK